MQTTHRPLCASMRLMQLISLPGYNSHKVSRGGTAARHTSRHVAPYRGDGSCMSSDPLLRLQAVMSVPMAGRKSTPCCARTSAGTHMHFFCAFVRAHLQIMGCDHGHANMHAHVQILVCD